MAMTLRGSVLVPASIERVWEMWTDAARYPQWQGGVIAVTDISGPAWQVGTTFVLDHGPKLKRRVRVVTADRPTLYVIEQDGVGVRDQTVTTFEPEGDATRLSVAIYLHLNRVMRVLATLDRGDRSQRELQRELDRFADLALRRPIPVSVGDMYVVKAGPMRRRVTVIGGDDDRVHIRLHSGHLRSNDPDDVAPVGPKPLAKEMDLRSIPPPIRGGYEITAQGLPFLLRDGGQGVGHLALAMDAWADADARQIGHDVVTETDHAAVEDWRTRHTPTVGVDVEVTLAPMCTFRIGNADTEEPPWAVAKVLKSEILKIHLSIYGARWHERPTAVEPWRFRLGPPPEAGAKPSLGDLDSVDVGHYALDRTAFTKAEPRFIAVTTLEDWELEGYRIWRHDKGGTFDTLAPLVGLSRITSPRPDDDVVALSPALEAALKTFARFLISDDDLREQEVAKADAKTLERLEATVHGLVEEIDETLDRLSADDRPRSADQELLEESLHALAQSGSEARMELDTRASS